MAQPFDPATREALVARVRFYRELGLTEFYRRPIDPALLVQIEAEASISQETRPEARQNLGAPGLASETGETASQTSTQEDQPIPPRKPLYAPPSIPPTIPAADRSAALQMIREDIGDCTRCALHKGRNKIVFGDGSPSARLMFVGEGPGADEDADEKSRQDEVMKQAAPPFAAGRQLIVE